MLALVPVNHTRRLYEPGALQPVTFNSVQTFNELIRTHSHTLSCERKDLPDHMKARQLGARLIIHEDSQYTVT